jgi:hypothetical protein
MQRAHTECISIFSFSPDNSNHAILANEYWYRLSKIISDEEKAIDVILDMQAQ